MLRTCDILGVRISSVNMDQALQYIYDHLNEWKQEGSYICISNVHTTVYAHDHPEYLNIQNNAVLALPDGKPLAVICKKRGNEKASRVTGPDLMGKIFSDSANKGFRHFFYGSTPETLKSLRVQLSHRYPELTIAGMYSPPFRPLTSSEEKMVIDLINRSNSDFIWVGLGAPKQEQWMYEYHKYLSGLLVGVGAGFDYYAGNIKRAPRWMQSCSLEWLFRLMQDPRRLFKRYLYTNTKFLWLLLKDRDGKG